MHISYPKQGGSFVYVSNDGKGVNVPIDCTADEAIELLKPLNLSSRQIGYVAATVSKAKKAAEDHKSEGK